jgi:CRISPR/Cas system-associated endoribonuclease Cas2
MLIHKIPAEPSGARVSVWRKLKSYGAVSLQNSVWVLPDNDNHNNFFRALKTDIEKESGSAFIFKFESLDSQEAVIEAFMNDRNAEYLEFLERCNEFLEEIKKEVAVEKFTYAELEEIEVDLQKLDSWLNKINSRDFFTASKSQEATKMLQHCHNSFKEFSNLVYQAEGLKSDS